MVRPGEARHGLCAACGAAQRAMRLANPDQRCELCGLLFAYHGRLRGEGLRWVPPGPRRRRRPQPGVVVRHAAEAVSRSFVVLLQQLSERGLRVEALPLAEAVPLVPDVVEPGHLAVRSVLVPVENRTPVYVHGVVIFGPHWNVPHHVTATLPRSRERGLEGFEKQPGPGQLFFGGAMLKTRETEKPWSSSL
jgi:hypothetical protein